MKPLIDNFPDIMKSALLTIELTVLSILIGLVIGFIFALMRISRNKLLFYFSY
jgi:polar amino acid transport system permease protein